MPPLDRDRLRLACLEVARGIAWRRGPVDELLASSLAEVLFAEALFHEDYLVRQDRDPNIIAWAVSYIAHAHAIPPHGADVGWFRESLGVLVELACPNSSGRRQDERLYREIEVGIGFARKVYDA